MKKCVKCKQIKPVQQFNFKNKEKGRRNGRCKECTRKDIMAAYYKNRDYYLQYRARHNKKVLLQKQKFLYNYFQSHPCVDCGIDDPIVLQFDHVRGEKKGAVSNMLYSRGCSMKTIIAEIEKCEIRCANCHARKTAEELGYYAVLKKSLSRDRKLSQID